MTEPQQPWKSDKWFSSPWNYLPEVTAGFNLVENLKVHDVTLRDGEQQANVEFTADDKVRIAEALSEAGVHRIVGDHASGEGVYLGIEPGLGKRAVRVVFESQRYTDRQWEAICSVASKLGPAAETVRLWVRQAESEAGARRGLTTDERAWMRELEREVKELRRANEILKSASLFFATELDGRTRK